MTKKLEEMTPEERDRAFQTFLAKHSLDDVDDDIADAADQAAGSVTPLERHFPRFGELTLELGDFFFFLEVEGVQRMIVSFFTLGDATTFAKGRGGRAHIQLSASWDKLSPVQRDALCQSLWSTDSGDFAIVDAVTGELVTTHTIAVPQD